MRLNDRFIFIGIAAVLTGLVAIIAYMAGKSQAEGALSALAQEVENLKAGQEEAAVVKRVSQQMEEIAYQQKAVSDKQRDKAEKSSKLANAMRDRAEQESRAAREAEKKAMAALNEATVQRANAVEQQKIAVEQRDKATLAKTIADTLHFRTQARTLGNTSVNKRDSEDSELSDLLAYAGWYFLNKYDGNTYYDETFKSLSLATDGVVRYATQKRGSVNAVAVVPGREQTCVAATNYGEIELFTHQTDGEDKHRRPAILLQDSRFDFRDVWAGQDAVYALSFSNQLCVVDYNGHLSTIDLPADSYFKIICLDSNTLLLAARRLLCFYTISSHRLSAPIRLKTQLSTLVKRERQTCLFYADGSYATMDGSGTLTPHPPLIKNIVTAAHYSPSLQCLCLGMKDGTVVLVNKYDRLVEFLDAHKSRVVSIATLGTVLVSGAYDKALYIWKLDKLLFQTGLSFWQEMQTKTPLGKNADVTANHVPGEWISPVEFVHRGWTLSVCTDEQEQAAWTGTSTGEVVWTNLSADNMAKSIHRKLKRNLTPTEWTRFLGASMPYTKFK